MANFDVGETVICSITVKNASGTLVDPADSMKVSVTDSLNNEVLAATAMTDDAGDGTYHYDLQTAGLHKREYTVKYTADDGTRITIDTDTFTLV